MGIRFRIFLLDRAPFEVLLDRPLGDVHDELQSRDVDPEDLIELVDHDQVDLQLTGDEKLRFDPVTARLTVRDYLSQSWSGCLEGLLSALSDQDASRGVARLLDGHRRWWVGCLLQTLADNPAFQDRGEATARLAVRILRSLDCGFPLPPDPGLDALDLPVRPAREEDCAIGAWGPADLASAWTLFEELLISHVRWAEPRGRVGIAPIGHEAWGAWLEEILRALLAGRELRLARPTLVSFLS